MGISRAAEVAAEALEQAKDATKHVGSVTGGCSSSQGGGSSTSSAESPTPAQRVSSAVQRWVGPDEVASETAEQATQRTEQAYEAAAEASKTVATAAGATEEEIDGLRRALVSAQAETQVAKQELRLLQEAVHDLESKLQSLSSDYAAEKEAVESHLQEEATVLCGLLEIVGVAGPQTAQVGGASALVPQLRSALSSELSSPAMLDKASQEKETHEVSAKYSLSQSKVAMKEREEEGEEMEEEAFLESPKQAGRGDDRIGEKILSGGSGTSVGETASTQSGGQVPSQLEGLTNESGAEVVGSKRARAGSEGSGHRRRDIPPGPFKCFHEVGTYEHLLKFLTLEDIRQLCLANSYFYLLVSQR